MSDVITLSSDEERSENPIPPKKRKLNPVNSVSIIIDDEPAINMNTLDNVLQQLNKFKDVSAVPTAKSEGGSSQVKAKKPVKSDVTIVINDSDNAEDNPAKLLKALESWNKPKTNDAKSVLTKIDGNDVLEIIDDSPIQENGSRKCNSSEVEPNRLDGCTRRIIDNDDCTGKRCLDNKKELLKVLDQHDYLKLSGTRKVRTELLDNEILEIDDDDDDHASQEITNVGRPCGSEVKKLDESNLNGDGNKKESDGQELIKALDLLDNREVVDDRSTGTKFKDVEVLEIDDDEEIPNQNNPSGDDQNKAESSDCYSIDDEEDSDETIIQDPIVTNDSEKDDSSPRPAEIDQSASDSEKNKEENQTDKDESVLKENNSDLTNNKASTSNETEVSTSKETEASTSNESEASKMLEVFLDACAASIKNTIYESRVLEKYRKMRKFFTDCAHIHDDPVFIKTVRDNVNKARLSAPNAVVSFSNFYKFLQESVTAEAVELPEDVVPKVRKLEKVCRLLTRKLKKLEEAEVNWDDDDNSTYLKMDRYAARLNKVYTKYCQLLKKNPYSGRLLHEKIQFVGSKHNEINKAVSKSCRQNKFPSYFDVEKIVRKCASKHSLPLSEASIKEESTVCFKQLGNLLQLRRKKELYDNHSGFITLNEDPAVRDPELESRLKKSSKEGEQKLQEIVEKFVKMQDNREDVQLSEDSDDSDHKETSSDEEVEFLNVSTHF